MARFTPRRPNAQLKRNTKKAVARKSRDRAVTPSVDTAAAKPLASTRPLRRGAVANVAVMTLAVGIVGTLAIPAYAFAPGSNLPQFGTSAETELTKAQAQSVEVADDVIAAPVTKDGFEAVTAAEIEAAAEAKRQAEAAEAARVAAEAEMASYAASYDGPSAGDFLANPAYPSYDLGSVYNVATQYIGTPYVYGGATPAGFDCSGFVMYVFAQFGIGMPHSSAGQGAMGTRISEADAQPGDLVIMDGHDGFYAGNGMILHAPYEGASVRVQPIWTSDYYIVRIGI
ncbi:cell wall-associated NlpC family hydrolase [Agromyces terreus]|uniref:Cell wall-associated NlpC family hydrolase n=1 Tax=Agromyces terreus TaxID=424795 RepID=A0A9X2H3I7_9MICO|nr:C40 family peptidase [Agromyces terreus]MCP2372586.1 cell wall-associated NlpC family hydrolase [Agromyces terreus]